MDKKTRIKHYAVIERLYERISKKVNYCLTECIPYTDNKGCCIMDFHLNELDYSIFNENKHLKELIEYRSKWNPNLGNRSIENENKEHKNNIEIISCNTMSCSAHNPKIGCTITKYKPITCISFFCGFFDNYFKRNYGEFNLKKMKNYPTRQNILIDLLKGKISEKNIKSYEYGLLSVIKNIDKTNKKINV